MQQAVIRRWSLVHTWTSLVSTVFLLMLCITGLPLIFHEEIHHLTEDHAPFASPMPGAGPASIDAMVRRAVEAHPGIPSTVRLSHEEQEISVFTIPSWEAVTRNPDLLQFVTFDANSGTERKRSKPVRDRPFDFMELMVRLHVDMFLMLPGQLFLGVMGLLLLAAIVSGIVLYGPFTRKLDFGAVRATRARRVRWLDLHNLLGITSAAWLIVVGATGVLHELSSPLYQRYLATDVAAVTKRWADSAPPEQDKLASIDDALAQARTAVPDMAPLILFYPGSRFSTAHHYMIWSAGKTPLTSQLQTSILIDARTGELTAVVPQPWYLKAVQIGRPLHYGDYGGVPLKIIWALLDIVTIVVLGSGLYLWFARRRRAVASEAVNVRATPQMQPAE
ncbi:MAG: PepSY-associated TM helix domain-containing protein [Sphingobium sp.]